MNAANKRRDNALEEMITSGVVRRSRMLPGSLGLSLKGFRDVAKLFLRASV